MRCDRITLRLLCFSTYYQIIIILPNKNDTTEGFPVLTQKSTFISMQFHRGSHFPPFETFHFLALTKFSFSWVCECKQISAIIRANVPHNSDGRTSYVLVVTLCVWWWEQRAPRPYMVALVYILRIYICNLISQCKSIKRPLSVGRHKMQWNPANTQHSESIDKSEAEVTRATGFRRGSNNNLLLDYCFETVATFKYETH